MALHMVNFTQNKLGLKPVQDFSPSFVPAIRALSTVINQIFI